MKKLLMLLPLVFFSCSKAQDHLTEAGKLSLKEVSGIEYIPGSNSLWAIEDSGNKNKLYKLGPDGSIMQTIVVNGATNTDWEELAADDEGNLYIGDFGNNDNDRKDLAIYKLIKDKTSVEYKVSFNYPEQTEFPPKKSRKIFDCEAFIVHNGSFYLFTKNRSSGFDGTLNIYKLPNKEGNYKAQLAGSLTTCSTYRRCAVTAADISADGTKVVLLSGDKIWTITEFGNDNFDGGKMKMFELGHFSQKEGICFKDDDALLITDEREKKEGGSLYEVKLSDLNSEL